MYRSTQTLFLSICLVAAGGVPAVAQEASPDVAVPSETPLPADTAPWPSTELPGAWAITAGHGRFVVVGSVEDEGSQRATSWTSSDGLTWAEAPAGPELAGATMLHVTAFGEGYVAMGSEASDTPDEYYGKRLVAWTSPDGLTWQRASVERPGARGLQVAPQGVAVGPAGLLAYGNYFGQDLGRQRLWRSDDGLAWEVARFPDAGNVVFSSLAGSREGYFLAAAAGPGRGEVVAHLWRSADGVTWEAVADPAGGRPLYLAADDAGTVVGVGGLRIWVTSDLETWESTWASPDPGDGDASLSLVDWDGALFVTTGLLEDGSAPILVSADGITWVESNGPDGVPGPDPGTYLAGTATLDGVTVGLGDADGRTLAWLMGHVPTGEPDGSPAG